MQDLQILLTWQHVKGRVLQVLNFASRNSWFGFFHLADDEDPDLAYLDGLLTLN